MAETFHYGGQAVIEGVMIRGRRVVATAVRRPNGEISVDTLPVSPAYTGWMRRVPLLRGVIVLLETLVLGTKTLLYSANASLDEEGQKLSDWFLWILVAVSAGFSVLLFFVIPLLLTRLLDPLIPSALVFHLVEGLIRLGTFVAYLKVMTLMPDIRRVFAYHGAEHKTVNAYEAGGPLEVTQVKSYSTAHLRCGTSFLFTVLVLAILLFSLIGRFESIWLMLLTRIVLVPVIAALGYEVTRFAGNHTRNPVVRAILFPGLLLQRLTTREPDERQIEVAIAAMRTALAVDELEAGAEPR